MSWDPDFPRMSRIDWPNDMEEYVFICKSRLVLDQKTAETLIDAMVEEAYWRIVAGPGSKGQ